MALLHKLDEHKVYIILLIILSVFIVRHGIGLYNVQYAGDATSIFSPAMSIIEESFLKGVMPLWNPYIMSGTPLFAKAQMPVFSLYSVIQILSPTPYLAITINAFIHLIILGFGVYLLSRTVGLKPKFAFVSSLVCMLSAYVSYSLFFAFFQFMGLAFFPYVLMFTIKGLRDKKWLMYALLSGIFIALEFFSGSFEIFTFSWWVVLYVLVFNLLGKRFNQRLIKSIAFGVIFSIVAIGLVSIKLFPAIDLANISQRQQGFDFETSVGSHVNFGNAYYYLVDDRKLPNFIDHAVKGTGSLSLGIITSLLVLASLFNFKKKRYLFVLGMGLFGILMITKSPWNWLLWKFFPFFSKQKHVLKAEFVFLIAASILAAYGLMYLISKIKNERFAKMAYVGLIVLIVLTSWGLTYDIKMKDSREEIDSVEIMKYMSEDGDLFRFKAWETNGIDWGTNYYSKLYGLQDVYGYENLWLVDYLPRFLSVANGLPAKFFGILNMKYMTSMSELNISGFELVEKFDDRVADCEYVQTHIADFREMKQCPAYEVLKKAWGPYLYRNSLFLPRAYFVEDGLLVVGPKEPKLQTVFALMMDDRFEPLSSVVLVGKDSINDYDVSELSRYKAIFLTPGSIDANSAFILKNYVDGGGKLLPDVVNGATSIGEADINAMWDSFDGGVNSDVDYIEHNYNTYEANLDDSNGFLVLSEKFSMFPGWNVEGDGLDLDIEQADGVITAVYLDKDYDKVLFEYKPKSYVKGKSITLVTLLLIVVYFGYYFYKKKINKEKDNQ